MFFNFHDKFNYINLIQNSIFQCQFFGFAMNANGGGMKRWGQRATFLSSYTELDAWQNV